jgi:hypothetical protein
MFMSGIKTIPYLCWCSASENDKGEDNFICSSNGTNTRGESLMEYLVKSNLKTLNHSNKPTFVIKG